MFSLTPSDSQEQRRNGTTTGKYIRPLWTGPGIWVAVEVPEGVHEIALYFYNPEADIFNMNPGGIMW